MARLIVEAVVSGNEARRGTRDIVHMTVSVTRSDGQPVTTLTAADFTFGDTFGSGRVELSLFEGGRIQVGIGTISAGGIYMVEIVPYGATTWGPAASYHLVVVANDGTNHGQTVLELTLV
jgi:hypothetical protein